MRASVARAALDAGAQLLNDVSGGQADPAMLPLVAEAGVPYVVMHWRGHSDRMQQRAVYRDVVGEVTAELSERLAEARAAGVAPEQLVVDPGLGFAKLPEHSWELLAHLDALTALGHPLLVGASRKGFLGALLADPDGTPRARRRPRRRHRGGLGPGRAGRRLGRAGARRGRERGRRTRGRRRPAGRPVRDRIALTGLRVRGYHGVLPFEREQGQDFLVDVVLSVDVREPAASDDLEDTVDYGALALRLAEVVAGEPVNLLETLAERLADACLEDDRVGSAEVTVHKPSAPIPLAFADVSVTVVRP